MILVTGATGFLGTHLLQKLGEQSETVRALYHKSVPTTDFGNHVEWQQGNLLDTVEIESAMKGVKKVIHCAAIVSFDSRKSKEMIAQNEAITANIVNAALISNVEKFVHISSIAALGRTILLDKSLKQLIIDEETSWTESKQNSAYAESKYHAELEVWRGMAEGLNAIILNPSVILGEGDWNKGSAQLMQVVAKEFPWFTEGINGWVDVKDVVEAILLSLNSNIDRERFIINNGNYAYKDIFTKMALALNKNPPHKKAGKWMTELVWRIELLKSRLAGKEPTITRASARTAQTQCFYNNEKFLKQFPEFQYTPIETTIKRMAEVYKN